MSVVSVCFLVPSESEKSENYLMNYKVTLVLKCKSRDNHGTSEGYLKD